MFNSKELSKSRQDLYCSLCILVDHKCGVGMASADMIKQTLEDIEGDKFDDGNWLALEYQGQMLVDKAVSLMRDHM
jgi:hypothetical protein